MFISLEIQTSKLASWHAIYRSIRSNNYSLARLLSEVCQCTDILVKFKTHSEYSLPKIRRSICSRPASWPEGVLGPWSGSGWEKPLPFILPGFLRRKWANAAALDFLRASASRYYSQFKYSQELKLSLGKKWGTLGCSPKELVSLCRPPSPSPSHLCPPLSPPTPAWATSWVSGQPSLHSSPLAGCLLSPPAVWPGKVGPAQLPAPGPLGSNPRPVWPQIY